MSYGKRKNNKLLLILVIILILIILGLIGFIAYDKVLSKTKEINNNMATTIKNENEKSDNNSIILNDNSILIYYANNNGLDLFYAVIKNGDLYYIHEKKGDHYSNLTLSKWLSVFF